MKISLILALLGVVLEPTGNVDNVQPPTTRVKELGLSLKEELKILALKTNSAGIGYSQGNGDLVEWAAGFDVEEIKEKLLSLQRCAQYIERRTLGLSKKISENKNALSKIENSP